MSFGLPVTSGVRSFHSRDAAPNGCVLSRYAEGSCRKRSMLASTFTRRTFPSPQPRKDGTARSASSAPSPTRRWTLPNSPSDWPMRAVAWRSVTRPEDLPTTRRSRPRLTVAAPTLIARKPGERIKTDRRDSQKLALQHRFGDLTEVWVPDPVHEAIRDLVRARMDAVMQLMRARQQCLAFLLRHGRNYGPGKKNWTLLHRS